MTRTTYDLTWGKDLIVDEQEPGYPGELRITRIPTFIREKGWAHHAVPLRAHLNFFNKGVSEDLNRPYSYTVDTLPPADSSNENLLVFVTDDKDGRVLASSDGTKWVKVKDNAIVSKT